MSILKLHTFNPMDHGFRVRWLLAEMDIDVEIMERDFDSIKSDEFAKLNPFKRIPVVETEQGIFYESSAICWWLAQKYNSDLLLSPDDSNFPLMLQWVFLASSNFDSAAMSFAIAYRMQLNEKIIAERKDNLTEFLEPLSEHFVSNHWVLGDRFTLPDVLLIYPIMMIASCKGLEDYPSLKRYLHDFMTRSAGEFFKPIYQSIQES